MSAPLDARGWGVVYGVGVGPGDPELMTVKAVCIVRSAPVIAVPVAQEDGESYAFEVARGVLRPEQTILRLHFPMTRDLAHQRASHEAAARQVTRHLVVGQSVAFLTEGDPLIHSTFYYLMRSLPAQARVQVIPGVSSINAAAAEALQPLVYGRQRLAVLPAAFESAEELQRLIQDYDTIVLLKVHRRLDRVIALLEDAGLAERAVVVEKATAAEGAVYRDVRSLRGRQVHYLSLMIIASGRGDEHAD